jgi:DNA-binding NarL/FixJ family response regulator
MRWVLQLGVMSMTPKADVALAEAADVLIVEDEALITMAVEDALLDAGYQLRGSASTEKEAYDLCAISFPTFAVVDLNLGPGGNGINVGRKLAARGTLVLFASADCPGQRDAMAAAGAMACIGKPYDAAQVATALEKIRLLRDSCATRVPSWLHILTRGSR